jgi:hypothetical protein
VLIPVLRPLLRPVVLTPAMAILLGVGARVGQVANHTFTTQTQSGTHKEIMSRSRHGVVHGVRWLKLVFPNFKQSEEPTGADATITAAIEYPEGVFTQVTFSGATTGTIPDGDLLESDPIPIIVPDGGAYIFVRSKLVHPIGIVYHPRAGLTALGEAATYGASGVADQTMGGTIVPTGGVNGNILYGPIAILGHARCKSAALIGDSRVQGGVDAINGTGQNHVGELARSFGDDYAYANLGIASSNASEFASADSKIVQLARAYFTHVVGNWGINDLNNGFSVADTLANIQTVRALIGRPYFHCTVAPRSTGSWESTASQTTHVTNTKRVQLNNLLRAVPSGMAGVFELADVVESARDSGLWTPTYTSDGLHENQTGCEAIRDSGVIDPATVFAA